MDYLYLACRRVRQKYKLARYRKIVAQANQREGSLTGLDDDRLTEEINDLHGRAQGVCKIDSLLPAALALGREVSRRRLGMRHYDVQLIGTLALYEGNIAEMDTGEGKTLMAPLAAFIHQLGHLGRCTHIVTANEYLASRDAQWMRPLCEGLGMSVGVIVPGQTAPDRVRAYQHDVIYATAKEVVFDSLREPMRRKKTDAAEAILRPQRELMLEPKYDFVIIDEIDNVLIDQARSPLSIGGESGVSARLELYNKAEEIAGQLVRGKHYRLLMDDRKVELTDPGKAEGRRRGRGVLRLLPPGHKWERYVTCALAARHIYKCDQHYVVRDNRIVLIDESTGRLLPGRQLPDGLHQALEVHSRILPSAELRGNYMTTFQAYFRKYSKLAGMTGTALCAAWEFVSVYGLKIMSIPSNKPSRRHQLPDRIYRSHKSKYEAMVDHICRMHATGRPLLIGTGSVRVSERLSNLLQQKNLKHEVLNAKNHAREAEIIAQAGQEGGITIITNMAGRGVDIVLGPGVAERGGIFLVGSDRLHYRRLDDQLAGRVGRQGDPSDCQFFLSLRDDLLRFADRKKITRLRMRTRSFRNKSITEPAAERLIAHTQKHIEKIAGQQRHKVYQMEKQREKLKEQGLWEDWMDAQ